METSNLKENIDWIAMALAFKFGWALGLTTWRAVLAWTYGLVSKAGQTAMENMIPEDKDWAISLFNHRAYRIFRALFKALTSIQLPEMPRKPTGDTKPPFPPASVMLLTAFALFCGCTHLVMDQTECGADGIKRHTRTVGTTFFDSKSELSKLRASTTDKSQTQTIGALSQEANSTGSVQVIKLVIEGAKLAVP